MQTTRRVHLTFAASGALETVVDATTGEAIANVQAVTWWPIDEGRGAMLIFLDPPGHELVAIHALTYRVASDDCVEVPRP
jgi:hypothetical protein